MYHVEWPFVGSVSQTLHDSHDQLFTIIRTYVINTNNPLRHHIEDMIWICVNHRVIDGQQQRRLRRYHWSIEKGLEENHDCNHQYIRSEPPNVVYHYTTQNDVYNLICQFCMKARPVTNNNYLTSLAGISLFNHYNTTIRRHYNGRVNIYIYHRVCLAEDDELPIVGVDK
jgi:hypothetical protein